MKRWFKQIDGADVLMVLGLIHVGVGLWMFEPWVSLFVVGLLLLRMGEVGQGGGE